MEDFAAVLWHPSFPQSDYSIACRCVGLVAELAAAAARHLNDALHTVSIPNKQGPPHSHSTTWSLRIKSSSQRKRTLLIKTGEYKTTMAYSAPQQWVGAPFAS